MNLAKDSEQTNVTTFSDYCEAKVHNHGIRDLNKRKTIISSIKKSNKQTAISDF